jgi:hypothetical protein
MRVVAGFNGGGVLLGRFVRVTRAIGVAPQYEQFAQMLHAFAAQFFANFSKVAVTNFAFVAASAHFDQGVRGQREVNLVQHGWCESVLTHHDDRVKVVRGSAQCAACTGGQGGGRGRGHGVAFSLRYFAYKAELP